MAAAVPKPSRCQRDLAREITRWYLRTYYRSQDDVGTLAMFCRQDRVGHFAVDAAALAAGEGPALFRLLVTMTMFQRRSDSQIMRVLRGINERDAVQLTCADSLLTLADSLDCPHARALSSLKTQCDLGKDPATKRGICEAFPSVACHLKRHTELLKRYGHFGKVPTSAALTLRDHGVANLAELKDRIWAQTPDPSDRAIELERAISRSWRVSEKIASMFLSAITNRDLSGDLAPWADGVDSSRFVVIDSNVDLFLLAAGYAGPKTYRARRQFVQALAEQVPLDEYLPDLRSYNPRIVQQALFMFMSKSNRRASLRDCSYASPSACGACPSSLNDVCSVQPAVAGGGSRA